MVRFLFSLDCFAGASRLPVSRPVHVERGHLVRRKEGQASRVDVAIRSRTAANGGNLRFDEAFGPGVITLEHFVYANQESEQTWRITRWLGLGTNFLVR